MKIDQYANNCKLTANEIHTLLSSLSKLYPDPQIALRFTTALELLIATILSAQCTDERVNMVTETLFKKYRNTNDYADTLESTFEEEIRPTGFYKNKARMIIECAKKLRSDFAGKVPDNMDDLVTLPGVGRKTASVILSAAFSVPAIAVDTHVLRVSNRLGLVSSKDAEKTEMALRTLIAEHQWIHFTLSVILFGRHTCKARKPLCTLCELYPICKWPERPPKS